MLPPSLYLCKQSVTILDRSSCSKHHHKLQLFSVKMPDSHDGMPAPCQVIKEDFDKCVREKGEEACNDLIDAFQACIKTLSEGS
ncbi:hypothetical protein EPR50_G00214760 [Perca flavescens]|uniref:Uncharacterized protein n=1 Tax=Perca flavescens TaxID=8167 RepID=A0A484C2Q2_PERFV|nr:hypothetical protein EPR50_G00214760 [Perca flavescens]